MSAVLERIRDAARAHVQRLVLPEAEDDRILEAAGRLDRDRLATVTLVGDPAAIERRAGEHGWEVRGVRLADAREERLIERTRAALAEQRGPRLETEERERLARDPLFQAASLVRAGEADAFVAGATHTTAEVLRAALWLVGMAPGVSAVSSFFLMVREQPARTLVFADCGVIPEPTSAQLAEIACLASDAFRRLTGEPPRTALLSFSTLGSADHARVVRVREAVALARAARPDLDLDGELQADAALVPEVARRKAPGSGVAGDANVLVFPDLDAGNIGYKLVERLGGFRAYGPILMGLARPSNDLSRGCSADDVVGVATIACALGAAGRN